MLIHGERLLDFPVIGLQTGSELARTTAPVIDPAKLEIIGYALRGPLLDAEPSILRISDIRELSDIGMIVDSSDEFVLPEDVFKLAEVYNLHYGLIGSPVIDEKRQKLGKVIAYTLDTSSFLVQQLVVKRPLLKSFNDTELLIHRSQITEITNQAIVVHSRAKVPEPHFKSLQASYVNPFRKTPKPEPETIRLRSQ